MRLVEATGNSAANGTDIAVSPAFAQTTYAYTVTESKRGAATKQKYKIMPVAEYSQTTVNTVLSTSSASVTTSGDTFEWTTSASGAVTATITLTNRNLTNTYTIAFTLSA